MRIKNMRMKRKVETRGGNGLTGRERDDDRRGAGTGMVEGNKQWVSDSEELITNHWNLLKTEKTPPKERNVQENKANEDRLLQKNPGVTFTKEPSNFLPHNLNTPLPLVDQKKH